MKARMAVILLTSCLGMLVSQAADTFYVWRGNPAPQAPYDSWETAATEIQAALDLAGDGDTVLVTNGVYNTGGMPAPGSTLTNRLCATKAVAIRSVAPTREGAVIVGAAADGGSYGPDAVRGVYLDGGATISGFTITGGFTHTNDGVYANCAGGGAYLGSGTVISNCLVATNSAAWQGGGIMCYYGGLVVDCDVATNRCGFAGGGVYGYYGGTVKDSVIRLNQADNGGARQSNGGGGIFMASNNTETYKVIVTGCLVYGNSSKGYCGGVGHSYGKALIADCVITNNSGGYGGGVWTWIGGTVTNCFIADNEANYVQGGGVYSHSSLVTHSVVISNYSVGSAAGVHCRSTAKVENTLIAGNTAKTSGGGVTFSDNDRAVLKNCTIVNNVAGSKSDGVLFNYGTTMLNSIVWGNGVSNIHVTAETPPNISYSCISPLAPGERNIDGDPLFINSGRLDFRLSGVSPCVDSGLNEPWMEQSSDLRGKPRIRNGVVDMGAYEHYTIGTFFKVR